MQLFEATSASRAPTRNHRVPAISCAPPTRPRYPTRRPARSPGA